MIDFTRMALRLLLVLVWTLLAMPLQALLLLLPGRAKELFARTYWTIVRVILGIRLTIIGDLNQGRPTLFIANHCSWIDIVTLGSVLPGCFVAKAAIDHWPVINLVARLGRTIFVSRTRTGTSQERNQLEDRLQKGDNIILFPEGTTSDGGRILRFQSAFLALAASPAKPAIQPVTLVYDRLDGLPVRRRDRPLISWYGDMAIAPHFTRIGGHKLHATLVLNPPLPVEATQNRKALSASLEIMLAAQAANLRQGRKPEGK